MSNATPTTPRRSILWLARFLSLTFSTLLGLGAAEILLRMPASPQPTRPSPPALDPEIKDLPNIEGVMALAKPLQRARYRGSLFVNNSRGIRGPEYDPVAAPGTFRIEMIGDSYTMGSGVSVEQAYPAMVEEVLNGTGDERHYEVINLGLSGLSLEGSVNVRLRKIGLDYSPDLLVYGFTVNDLEGPDYVALKRSPHVPSKSLVLDLLRKRLEYFRDMVSPSSTSYVRELNNNFFENPKVWQRFESNLDRLAAIADERNICVVVLIHTQLRALNSWHPYLRHYAAVADAARERGMYVVDSFPWHDGIDPTNYVCGVYDSHPNALGHQILAESLIHGLRSLPARCWDGAQAPPN